MTESIIETVRIPDIFNLGELKRYACPKVQHISDWYLKCVDCKSKDKCKAGKQAIFIMNNETSPEKSKPEVSTDKFREQVIQIFSQPDPLRALLECSGDSKAPSVCTKVSMWKKRYPDLEDRFHMTEKVRFLWSKPYDSMRVPEVLRTLYSNDFENVVITPKSPTNIAPNSPVFTVKHLNASEDDDISLEDFLAETDSDDLIDADIPATPKAPAPMQTSERSSKEPSMNDILKKLQKEREECSRRISEIDKQIKAIETVQNLMSSYS